MKVALVKTHDNFYSEVRHLHLVFILASQIILILNALKAHQICVCLQITYCLVIAPPEIRKENPDMKIAAALDTELSHKTTR